MERVEVEVGIPLPLRKLTDGQRSVRTSGNTISELLADLDRQFPGLLAKLVDESGRLHRYINIYRNGEDIRFSDSLETAVSTDDSIKIITAAAGGSV